MSGQLSFFSADALPPSVADVEGLLAGPGQVVRRSDGARVSVVVVEEWRVQALVGALAVLGLDAELVPGAEGRTAVRTPFVSALLPVALRWTSGAVKLPPPGLQLDGPRLRWWALAAGRGDPAGKGEGYTLGLGASDEQAWPAVGAALAAAGVPGTFVGPRGDGPAYRIVGRRRLSRLRELVGEPPAGVPAPAWPSA
ncbi:MAG: hypothetical protein ACJ735_13990 [Actinomycetes bacterium]